MAARLANILVAFAALLAAGCATLPMADPALDSAAKTFSAVPGKSENEDTINLTTLAGQVYYVWQEVKMGLMYARNKLQLVDEKTGRGGVMECNLAKPSYQ